MGHGGILRSGAKRLGPAAGTLVLAAALLFGASPLLSAAPAAAAGLVGARAVARDLANGAAVTDAIIDRTATGSKVEFKLNRMLDVDAYVLADPDRVIVDLPETAFLISPAIGRPAHAGRRRAAPNLVASFRFGQFAPGRSRIVFDLSGPARIVTARSEPTESGGAARLVIELASSDADSFRAAARAARAARSHKPLAPAKQPQQAAAPAASDRPVMVIDAGHGGVDMGAVGGKGVYEKDVVLDFARRLASKLDADGKVKPVLTRRDDEFIPLGERVKIARKAGAALFMSIHADTLNEDSVHGATVYTVSDRASDSEAARVAATENAADKAGGMTESEDVVDVSDILADLTRRETRAMSHVFAMGLIDFWKKTADLNKNPIRSAGFVVLKAPDVPSVLLELGYLSNDHDLARLTSTEWRQAAVDRVAAAIELYFARRPQGAAEATASIERQAGLAGQGAR